MSQKRIELPALENDAAYAAAANRLAELKAEHATDMARHEATLSQLNELAAGTHISKVVDPLETAARRLIGGDKTQVPKADGMVNQLRDQLGSTSESLRVLEKAIEIQQTEVTRLLTKASNTAAELVRPAHRELVSSIVKCMHELDAALVAERGLRDEMDARGFLTSNIRAMNLHGHGLLSDRYSRAAIYLLECHEHGFLDVGELPEHLQKAVPPAPKPKAAKAIAAALDGWIGGD